MTKSEEKKIKLQQDIDMLMKLKEYFKPVDSDYQEIERLNNRYFKISKGPSKGLIVACILLGVLCICMLPAFLFENGLLPTIAHVCVPIDAIGSMIFLASFIITKHRYAKEIPFLDAQIAEPLERVKKHYEGFPDCPVPREYCSQKDLDILLCQLKNGSSSCLERAALFFPFTLQE